MIDRELATEMMESILEANDLLLQVLQGARQNMDPESAALIKRQIFHVMGIHLTSIMNPIGEQYPDLYPEALRAKPRDLDI